MSNKIVGFFSIAIFSLVLNTNAQAVIITETWSATISGGYTGSLSVGDVVEWTVTYDNEATEWNVYHDGPDGKAGTEDDYLGRTNYLSDYSQDYFLLADIYSNTFSNVLDRIGYAGLPYYDAYSESTVVRQGRKYYYGVPVEVNQFQMTFDSTQLVINDYANSFLAQNVYVGSNSPRRLITYFENVSVGYVTVSAPATLSLLASGLVWIGMRRRTKAKLSRSPG